MSQPPQYENAGIRFRYPENWRIVEEQADGISETVFAQSPGSGFWMLQHFPAQQESNDLTDRAVLVHGLQVSCDVYHWQKLARVGLLHVGQQHRVEEHQTGLLGVSSSAELSADSFSTLSAMRAR